MNSVKILFLLLAIVPFFGEINANTITASDKRINEFVLEWQDLIEYCNTLPREQTSASYQNFTANINQRLFSLASKTDNLTVNECLQAYNFIETDPETEKKPMDFTMRNSCHSCVEAMSIFNIDKADVLILHELGAGDKTGAEIKKDKDLQKELQTRRIRVSHTHVNKTLANPDEVKKKLDAILQKK